MKNEQDNLLTQLDTTQKQLTPWTKNFLNQTAEEVSLNLDKLHKNLQANQTQNEELTFGLGTWEMIAEANKKLFRKEQTNHQLTKQEQENKYQALLTEKMGIADDLTK